MIKQPKRDDDKYWKGRKYFDHIQFELDSKQYISESEAQNNEIMPDMIRHFASDKFIDNVCLSYRHDFGLMTEQDRQKLRFECKEWMRAIQNNWKYHKNI